VHFLENSTLTSIPLPWHRTGQRGVIVCFTDTPAAAVWLRSACEQLIQLRELFGQAFR
jgi:hypothetical protein